MHGDADYLFDATKAITLQSRSDIIRLTLLNRYSIIDICRWLLSEEGAVRRGAAMGD